MNKAIKSGVSLVSALACLWHLQASADTAADSSAPSTFAPIVGRIEQTASPEATLPVALTKLKAETPKMDAASPPPVLTGGVTQLQSEVADDSFPPYLLGYWGGSLTIVSAYFRPPAPPDPDRREGVPGMTVFHFIQEGSDTKLKPATIFLPPGSRAVKDALMTPEELEIRQERAAANGRQLDPNQIISRNPMIILGGFEWAKLNGATSKSTVTANTLHTLGPGVVEQDIVTKREGKTASGSEDVGYAEVICRVKQTGPDSVYVQVAKVGYSGDRSILRRLLLEGTLTRDWQQYADKISQQLHRPWEFIAQKHDI